MTEEIGQGDKIRLETDYGKFTGIIDRLDWVAYFDIIFNPETAGWHRKV